MHCTEGLNKLDILLMVHYDVVGGPRGRGFSRESRAITLDKGLLTTE